ncbi:MAG: hypothetical protein SF029_22905 [bacterium]|nr:hypothetical protein [bacterium]
MPEYQLPLFSDSAFPSIPSETRTLAAMGTFKDSKRAPIHSWFKYPAGYSNQFVADIMQRFDILPGHWIYDPFSGTGTTLVCAKQAGINGYGVEAHSFVHWVAQVKLFWEFDKSTFGSTVDDLLQQARDFVGSKASSTSTEGAFPELIYKCYHPQTLIELYLLREFISKEIVDEPLKNWFKLALTDTLRTAAAAGTGWPYIAPNKNTGDKPPKDALRLFEKTVKKMAEDLFYAGHSKHKCEIHNILGDSRQQQSLSEQQIDLGLTSPPYLNNYDYADRTRLETYFWGIAQSWKDITDQFRNKLMVAATTQIVRKNFDVESTLSEDVRAISPNVYTAVQTAVLELSKRRPQKGGKKDYDLMVALYVNDILAVLKEAYRTLRRGGHFCLVLGDSAPYGVHIPTETIVGELGLGLGFSEFTYEEFRTRGGKWKDNPQRHTVPLREGMVTLKK